MLKLELESVRRIVVEATNTNNRASLVTGLDKKIGCVRSDRSRGHPVARHLGNWIVEVRGGKIFLSPANTDRETEAIQLRYVEYNEAVVYFVYDGKEKQERYTLEEFTAIRLKNKPKLRRGGLFDSSNKYNKLLTKTMTEHKTSVRDITVAVETQIDFYREKYEKERERNDALQDLVTRKIETAIFCNQQNLSLLIEKNREMIEVLIQEEEKIAALITESENIKNKLINAREDKKNLEISIVNLTAEEKKCQSKIDGLEEIERISLEDCQKAHKKLEELRVRIQLDDQVLQNVNPEFIDDERQKLQLISDDLSKIERKLCDLINMKKNL